MQVPGLATDYHEFTPWITPDGMRLYFVAVYQFGFGGNDIFYRNRQPDGSWGPILNLGPPINSAADERAPCLSPDGRTFINSTGNPGMATGGTGDVLTGMIAGLLAQGYTSTEAACLGVYLHGLAGDLAAGEKGEMAMIAGDLIEKIPDAIKQIKGGD